VGWEESFALLMLGNEPGVRPGRSVDRLRLGLESGNGGLVSGVTPAR
jgi:hypothetical protein